MTDRIEVGIGTDGASELDGLTSAIGKLIMAVDKLGNMGSSLDALQRAMAGMHATMETGFREMETLAKGSGQRTAKLIEENGNVSASAMKAAGEKLLRANATTWRQVESVGSSNISKAFSELAQGIPVEAVKARWGELATVQAASFDGNIFRLKQYNETVAHLTALYSEKEKQRALAARTGQYEAEQKMMHDAYKMNEEFDLKKVASAQTAQEKLGAQLASYYSKEAAMMHDAYKMNEEFDAKRLASAEALAEKQRVLNTNFLTSSPAAQLHTVTQAQTYSSLGGNASAKYGSSAAAITEDSAAYLKLKSSTESSTHAILTHNAAMAEGHAFARGLSGALGTLWVTYGSIVPLLAGAAIAGSLKNIVEVGKEVEYQLKFVEALGGGTVNLDEFLKISEGTVVSVKAAGEGMRALAQNGLDAQQSLKAMPDILNLATIGEMNVGEAALAATGVVAAFNLELSDIGRVGDIFAKAAATSNTSVALMAESMKTASTAAGLYHVSIEETAASLGVLAKLNITGTAAGTSFRNVLKDLYTPTKKQAEGLDALGISTREASGELKSYTDIMTQLRDKTAGLSESGKLNFLSQISDERGAKTLAAVLGNWDSFIQKMDEASKAAGFNAAAVAKLEDSVEGSTRRAANAVSSTLMRAFQETSPAIEKLMLDLGDLAKSQGAIDTLVALGSAVLRLTQFILDHSTAIAELIAIYIGLRVVGSVVASYEKLALALGTSTIAATAKTVVTDLLAKAEGMVFVKTAAATGAIEAEAVAAASSVAPVAALTGAIEAEAAAAAASVAPITEATVVTFSLAGAVRVLMAAFGFITIAITLAVTAYELFFKKTSEGDKVIQQTDNTNKLLNETLDKQIEKLKEINGLRMVDGPKANMQSLVGAREALVAKNPIATMSSDTLREIHDLDDKIEAERLKSIEIERKQTEEADLTRMATTRQTHKDTLTNLQKFYAERNALNSDGLKKKASGQSVGDSDYLHSAAQRAVYAQAGAVQTDLNLHPENVAIATQKLTELKTALSKVSEGYEAAKEDTKAENDAFKAQMQILQNLIDLRKQAAGFKIDDIHASVKEGTTGKIEGAMQEYDTKTAAAKDELSLMQQQLALAATMDDRRALSAKIEGTIHKQQMDDLQNKRVMEQTIEAERLSMAEKVTKAAAEQATADHNYAMAAAIQWEAENGREKSGLQRDLAAAEARKQIADNMGMMGLPTISDEEYAKALGIIKDLEDRLKALGAERKIKIDTGSIKEATETLDIAFRKAATSIAELRTKAANVTDLGGGLQVSAEVGGINRKTIPDLAGAVTEAKLQNPTMDTSKFEEAIAKMKESMNSLAQSPMALMFSQMSKDLAGMGAGFERVAKATAGLSTAFAGLYKTQHAEGVSDKERTTQQLSDYGQIAGAAKGLFKEKTAGYKILDGIEKEMHLFHMASQMEQLYTSLFVSSASAAGVVAGKATETTAVVGAEAVKQVAMVPTVFMSFMSSLGPWGAAAAAVAIGAVLGGAFSGGSGGGVDVSAAAMQKKQGTGGVFGDSEAKSESIKKSIDLLGKNSDLMLPVTNQMAMSLRSIDAAMNGLTNIVLRTSGMTDSSNMGIRTGTLDRNQMGGLSKLSTLESIGGSILLGPLGAVLGKITGTLNAKLLSLWGKTSASITDGGLQLNGSIGQLQQGQGINQYANVATTKSSWFGLSKSTTNNTQTQGVPDELSQQFGQIFTNLQTVLMSAAGGLGKSSEAVGAAVQAFVIDTSKISLQGLKGADLQAAINAVISKAMDGVSQSVFPEVDKFRQVGEGYAQTVIRVANGIEQGQVSLAKFGITAIKFTDIINKQADVGGEIVRQTLVAFETDKAGIETGVGKILETMSGTAQDMEALYTSLIDLRKLMTSTGMNGKDLNQAMIQGAGGVSQLNSGLSSYLDKYFTPSEKSIAEMKSLSLSFDAFGVVMPKTKDAFRQLVESIDITTPAGAKLKGGILGLSDAFATGMDNAEAYRQTIVDTAQAAFDTAKSDLQSAYNAESGGLKSSIDTLRTLAKTLRDFRDGLLVGSQSGLSSADQLAEAKRQFETAAPNKLTGAAGTYLTLAKQNSASLLDYQRTFAAVSNSLGDAATTADKQADVAQSQLDTLNSQMSGLVTINTSVMSVKDALDKYFGAKEALTNTKASGSLVDGMVDPTGGFSDSAAGKGIAGLNQQVADYGKAYGGDAYYFAGGGASHFQDLQDNASNLYSAFHSNSPLNNIMTTETGRHAASLSKDELIEYVTGHTKDYWKAIGEQYDAGLHPTTNTKIDGSHADGLDYVPFDGYIAQLHQGERVQTSGQAASSDEVAILLRQLIQKMDAQSTASIQNTAETTKILKRWEGGGMPAVRALS